MKTKFSFSILVAFVMLLSVNAIAQKSIALVDSKKTHEIIDNKTVRIYFTLTDIANEAARQKFDNAFKSYQGAFEVKSQLMGNNTASYMITMPQARCVEATQQMLNAAGIEMLKVDGTDVPTKDMVAYSKKMEDEKKAKK